MKAEPVHGLWIGKELSPVELLCIKSFLANGHPFHLWLYNDLSTVLPEGVIVENAAEIIPQSEVFAYKNTNQFGHGKGSYAGFSDVFRYKLLFEKGGWWTDMDVVCLKQLCFNQEYVFRPHHDFLIVGNIMKCPPKSSFMLDCYNEAKHKVNENNTNWNLPIEILNNNLKKQKLQKYIIDFSNPDKWKQVRMFLLLDVPIEKHWCVVHLMNEEWRKNSINRKAIPQNSLVGKLYKMHALYSPSPKIALFINKLRILFPKSPLRFLYRKIF